MRIPRDLKIEILSRLTIALGCLCSVLVLSAGACAPDVSEIDTSGAVRTAEEAVQRAADYMGTPKTGPMASLAAKEAKVVTIAGDETPFLRHRINGSKAWHVTLRNVSLARTPEYADNPSTWRNLDVYIDSTNGELLKIVCDYQPLLPNEVGEMTPEYAEEQLRGGGDEHAVIPPDPPVVSFVAAARACVRSPLQAKQIEAQYVLYPYGEGTLKPVWIITLRGIPPLIVRGIRGFDPKTIPLYQLNHVSEFVDARTGKCFTDTNAPQYKLKDEDNPFKDLADSTKER